MEETNTVIEEQVPAVPVAETEAPENLDPEGDGLTKGQTTADAHGDVLGI